MKNKTIDRNPIRHFLTNIICAFIPNKTKRKKVRAILNSNVFSYIRFIKRDLGGPVSKIKTFIGYNANSLLISVNDKYIYKFPLRNTDYRERVAREKRITDALRPISPIKIPDMQILNYRDKLVRKYEFIDGVHIMHLPKEVQIKNRNVLAKQIAQFLYTVGVADPIEIRDMKPNPYDAPEFMHGWCQFDLYGNFIINPDNMQVVAYIDWEKAHFDDFSPVFDVQQHSPKSDLELARAFMAECGREYTKIYQENQK